MGTLNSFETDKNLTENTLTILKGNAGKIPVKNEDKKYAYPKAVKETNIDSDSKVWQGKL